MNAIFISYRRQDSAPYAGRIHDRLATHFGAARVFIDIDTIPLGTDFAAVLNEHLNACTLMLAVIGPDWLTIADEAGPPRLENAQDYVRQELAAGLARGIPLIPLLVGGARMPAEATLPEDLRALSRRQGFIVGDARFHRDIGDLIRALEEKSGFKGGDKKLSEATDIGGDWMAEVLGTAGTTYRIDMALEVFQNKLFGTVRYPTGQGGILEGKVENGTLSFHTEHVPQFKSEKATIHFAGKIEKDGIAFRMQSADGLAPFTVKRKK